jgi:DUF4097 and DUF4098 domain-containing protein YvlB
MEGKFDRTLTVTGPVDLDVNTGSGRIAVRVGSSSAVQISGLIRANDDWRNNAQEKVRYLMANPPIEQTGNTIRIGRISDSAYRNNVSISYEIVVPAETRVRSNTGSGSQKIEGVRGQVDAHTGSGSITLLDIGNDVVAETGSGSIGLDHVAGKVDAHTGSGSIRAEGISGPIKAETGSGGITLSLTAAERGGAGLDVEASTGSGSIEVSGINGSLLANTGSGGIRAGGIPAGDWKLETSSGSITMQLDANASFELYARTHSGGISTSLPITMTGTVTKHEMRGRVRNGGHLVEASTGSGSITIR